jgi:hypothetical protein
MSGWAKLFGAGKVVTGAAGAVGSAALFLSSEAVGAVLGIRIPHSVGHTLGHRGVHESLHLVKDGWKEMKDGGH